MLAFLGWPQCCLHSCAVQGVPQGVVASYPLPLPGAVQSMVTQSVAGLTTGRAGTIGTKHWMAQPVSQGSHKLRGTDEEKKSTEGLKKYCIFAFWGIFGCHFHSAALLSLSTEEHTRMLEKWASFGTKRTGHNNLDFIAFKATTLVVCLSIYE